MRQTITCKNWKGILSRENFGDFDSGYAKYTASNSYDPFTNPTNLNWVEQPIQIDPNASVITDCIVAGAERVESGVIYIYAVGHTGRVYKIQSNDPNTFNPAYDNPVLLATLSTNSPTFTMGGSLTFYGSTERIYIGHDKGVTQLNTDGTGETFVGLVGTWTQNVPRPVAQFLGNLYYGNGSNIAEVTSSLTVTTYTKLSPGFPSNTQVRDLDVSPDGIYLEAVVTSLTLSSILATTPDSGSAANVVSYVFKWNGTDTGYTSYFTYPSFSLTANVTFGQRQYVAGTDIAGATLFNPTNKILTVNTSQAPLPNAFNSNGNIVGWGVPEFVNGNLRGTLFLYGPLDQYYSDYSWYRQFQMSATSPETDIIRIPYQQIVSNFNIGQATNGYTSGVFGLGKLYFSTIETSPSPTTKYRFYKFYSVPTGQGTSMAGTYETQNVLFSKKQLIKEVRLYTEPLTTNNAFSVSLIGSSGSAMTNGTQTFSVGTSPVVSGQDYLWWNPDCAPTYTVGLKITNSGSANWTLIKAEIDYEEAGK